jgi:tetratricopeptide (TPR) repeat protein
MSPVDYDELKIVFRAGEDDGSYPVDASSNGSSVSGTMKVEVDERDLRLLALGVATRARGGTRGAGSPATEDVERIGKQLFESLFCNQVGERYRICTQTAYNLNHGLRITLSLRDAPELLHLPWEVLCDPEGGFLSLSTSTPVVRHLNIQYPREPLPLSPPLRILGMVSSPQSDEYAKLDTEKEKANLEAAVEPLVKDERVAVHWLEGGSARDLQLTLKNSEFQIFHFIGHGGYDPGREESFLLFEDEAGRDRAMDGKALATLLADRSTLRLVVLNSCEGARGSATDPFAGVAASLIRRSVPAAIAMQFEITDEAAIIFSGWFYEALADGEPLDTALAEARRAIYGGGENEVEWATPVLFTGVGQRIFKIEEKEDKQARSDRRERLITSQEEAAEAKAKPEREPPPSPSPPLPKEEMPTPNPTPTANAQSQVANLVRRAEASLRKRHNERAFGEFNRAVALDPDSAAALEGRGEANRRLHRLAEAEADFSRAVELDPSACGAFVGRAWVRMEVDRLEEAAADTEHALDINPDHAWALAVRGFIELQQVPPRTSEAQSDFENALESDPNLTEATFGLALVIGNDETDRAFSLLDAAIERDPRCVEAIAVRGWTRALKKDEEAMTDLNRAVEIDPRSPGVLLTRGAVLMMRGAYSEALADFELVAKKLLPIRTAWVQMGYAHLGLNDFPAALAAFDHALELLPGAAPPLVGRGVAKARLERFADGLADFEAALEIDPFGELLGIPLSDVLFWRGLAKLRVGKPLEALEDFEAGVARGGEESAIVLVWSAEAHLALEDVKSAYEDQQKAAKLEPALPEVLTMREQILQTLGRAAALQTIGQEPAPEREQRNQERLDAVPLERGWFTDQQKAMIEGLNGLEDLLWLCRCRRPKDVLRQTALLVTSERLLWCRSTLWASAELGELLWREVTNIAGEGQNVAFTTAEGTTAFVITTDIGTDLAWQAVQLDARDLRAFTTGLVAGWHSTFS